MWQIRNVCGSTSFFLSSKAYATMLKPLLLCVLFTTINMTSLLPLVPKVEEAVKWCSESRTSLPQLQTASLKSFVEGNVTTMVFDIVYGNLPDLKDNWQVRRELSTMRAPGKFMPL